MLSLEEYTSWGEENNGIKVEFSKDIKDLMINRKKINIPLIIFSFAFFLRGLRCFSIANIPLSWIGILFYVLFFII